VAKLRRREALFPKARQAVLGGFYTQQRGDKVSRYPRAAWKKER
jgi:hypothetical protein